MPLPDVNQINGFLVWLFCGAPQIAAWSTLLSMVVLYYYTMYTRRMMLATESTMRATTRPLLQVVGVRRAGETVVLTIRNAGSGPALNVDHWIAKKSVSKAIPIGRRPGYIQPANFREDLSSLEVLPAGDQETLQFRYMPQADKPWEDVLIIVHAEDIAANRYQNATKIHLEDDVTFVEWQSLSEQLHDDHIEEGAVVKWWLDAKRKLKHASKAAAKAAKERVQRR